MDVYHEVAAQTPCPEQTRRVPLSLRVVPQTPCRTGEGALQIDQKEGSWFIYGHARSRYPLRSSAVRAAPAMWRTDQDGLARSAAPQRQHGTRPSSRHYHAP